MLCLLLVVVDNLAEVRSLQAGAADQAAVDFGLSHETLNVLGVHGSAVLDADLVRGALAILAGHGGTDDADGLVRLFIGGGQAAARAGSRSCRFRRSTGGAQSGR